MAFNGKQLGGNVNASALDASVFTYQTPDTIAVVVAADYFSRPEGDTHKFLVPNTIIMAECADGHAVLNVVLSTGATITVANQLTGA